MLVDTTWGELQPLEAAPGVRTPGEHELLAAVDEGAVVVDCRTRGSFGGRPPETLACHRGGMHDWLTLAMPTEPRADRTPPSPTPEGSGAGPRRRSTLRPVISPAPVPEQVQRVAALFDRVAATYDAVGVPWFTPIARHLVAELDPQPGERALDLGCGRGAATFPLAEAVGPSGHVTALDLAPRMVQCLSAEAATRGLEHVEPVLGNAAAPELGDRTYDVVAASLVLFLLPDPAEALARWTDLLVPGGRLGVTTYAEQTPAYVAVDDLFTRFLPQHLLDARANGRGGPFATTEGVEGLLRGAGLVDVRTVLFDVDLVLRDADHWHAWTWSHGQRGLWEQVPPDHRHDVRSAAADILETTRGDDGQIHLGQQVRATLGRCPA